jgi:Acetyltransferase (GNAT) domain
VTGTYPQSCCGNLNNKNQGIKKMVTATFLSRSIKTQVVSSTDSAWQECLNALPYDFYHLPGYLELEADRHNATSEAIIIKDGSEVFFLAYLIRDCRNISDSYKFGREPIYDVISPYGYSGMLVSQAGQNPRFIKKCLNIIYEYWQKKNVCSAFIRLHPLLNSYIDRSTLLERGDADSDQFMTCNHRFTVCERGDVVICDLTNDVEEIWKQFRSSHRTKINKLRRAGFTVKIGSGAEDLDIFIDIYLETMNRVNASNTYYFTRDYFEKLFQALGDRLNICLVEVQGEIVAASLITEFNGIVQYHLGGTRTAFLPQSPTTIMFDYIIKWAKERHNQYVNLGGGLGSNQDSLYHFKAGFSDLVKSFVTIETIVNPDIYEHLIRLRAEYLGKTIPDLKNTSFFPIYRS